MTVLVVCRDYGNIFYRDYTPFFCTNHKYVSTDTDVLFMQPYIAKASWAVKLGRETALDAGIA